MTDNIGKLYQVSDLLQDVVASLPEVGSGFIDLERAADNIVQQAVTIRGKSSGLAPARQAALLRRVRKALGYTYP